MRLSTSRYPEYIDFYCFTCADDRDGIKVDSIEADDVRVECPVCGDATYVRVVD